NANHAREGRRSAFHRSRRRTRRRRGHPDGRPLARFYLLLASARANSRWAIRRILVSRRPLPLPRTREFVPRNPGRWIPSIRTQPRERTDGAEPVLATVAARRAVGSDAVRSTAPMSHFGPCGRFTPRWSFLIGQLAFGTAFTAGLVAAGSMVLVGPP